MTLGFQGLNYPWTTTEYRLFHNLNWLPTSRLLAFSIFAQVNITNPTRCIIDWSNLT
jgi:hypothetical protein